MVGNGEGLVVGEGVGCGVGARGQACELCNMRHGLLDIVKREEREGFESCNKAKEWKGG